LKDDEVLVAGFAHVKFVHVRPASYRIESSGGIGGFPGEATQQLEIHSNSR